MNIGFVNWMKSLGFPVAIDSDFPLCDMCAVRKPGEIGTGIQFE